MENNLQYAQAMYDRLVDALPGDWDIETKELIGQAFLAGMAEYPDILNQLKSSSLIESDYFDDPEYPREVKGKHWRMVIRKGKASKV